MKKIVCFVLVLTIIIQSFFVVIQADTSVSYCILSTSDNYVIDSYNDTHTQSVASISKVMTAIVVLENIDINTEVTIDDSILSAYGSSIYLQVGDVYTVEELLYGLLLRSGNDAAVQLAVIVGKDIDNFVHMMNEKASQLGLVNTVFNNPSGLDEEDGGNVSTSCEMAYIMSYAMRNDVFKVITSTSLYQPSSSIYWVNKNKFLTSYEDATGGKTGYTELAKRTLVTVSEKDGMEIVVVTLNCSDDFIYHEQLHDYAYENYELLSILTQGVYKINNEMYVIDDFNITIEKDENVDANLSIKSSTNDGLSIEIKYKDREMSLSYE